MPAWITFAYNPRHRSGFSRSGFTNNTHLVHKSSRTITFNFEHTNELFHTLTPVNAVRAQLGGVFKGGGAVRFGIAATMQTNVDGGRLTELFVFRSLLVCFKG